MIVTHYYVIPHSFLLLDTSSMVELYIIIFILSHVFSSQLAKDISAAVATVGCASGQPEPGLPADRGFEP